MTNNSSAVAGELQIEYRRMWNPYFRDVPLFPGSAVDGVCRITVPVGVAEHSRYGYLCDIFGNRKLVFCMRCLCSEIRSQYVRREVCQLHLFALLVCLCYVVMCCMSLGQKRRWR